MKQVYSIDTSFFIACWYEYYRKTFFNKEDFFQMLIKKSKEYNFYVHYQVHNEINKKTDELSKWFDNNINYFYKTSDEKEQKIVDFGGKIIKKYQKLSKKPSKADHFVISSADILNATVISNEKKGTLPKERENAKTIPAVCEPPAPLYSVDKALFFLTFFLIYNKFLT